MVDQTSGIICNDLYGLVDYTYELTVSLRLFFASFVQLLF